MLRPTRSAPFFGAVTGPINKNYPQIPPRTLQKQFLESQTALDNAFIAHNAALIATPVTITLPIQRSLELEKVNHGLQLVMAAVDSALERAVPLTLKSRQEQGELLLCFSTDPKGLGLSEDQFFAMGPGEWLELFQGWERSREDSILAKHLASRTCGKVGRPPKDQTSKVHAEWEKLGRPKAVAAILDKIARTVFPAELQGIVPGTQKHRNARERVRQAISRYERKPAT